MYLIILIDILKLFNFLYKIFKINVIWLPVITERVPNNIWQLSTFFLCVCSGFKCFLPNFTVLYLSYHINYIFMEHFFFFSKDGIVSSLFIFCLISSYTVGQKFKTTSNVLINPNFSKKLNPNWLIEKTKQKNITANKCIHNNVQLIYFIEWKMNK